MSNQKRHEKDDSFFHGIFKNEGGYEGIMDAFVGFLCRKTDYFGALEEKPPKGGFLEGLTQQLTVKVIIFVCISIL